MIVVAVVLCSSCKFLRFFIFFIFAHFRGKTFEPNHDMHEVNADQEKSRSAQSDKSLCYTSIVCKLKTKFTITPMRPAKTQVNLHIHWRQISLLHMMAIFSFVC